MVKALGVFIACLSNDSKGTIRFRKVITKVFVFRTSLYHYPFL